MDKSKIGDHVKRCGHWNKRDISSNSRMKYWIADKMFKEIDIDENNNISINEANNFLENSTPSKKRATFSLEKKFATMDENNDGNISPSEFDESL